MSTAHISTVEEALPGVVGWLKLDMPVRQRLLALFAVKWTIGALRALVELGVPDELAAGPRTAAQLGAATGTDPDTLYRLLRAAAAAGVLDEDADGNFALTAVSAGLVSGAPDGIRDMLLFASDPMMWRPYENLAHTARTGQPAFEHFFGASFYDYTRANPASGAVLDRAMAQNHYPGTDRILDSFDFARFGRIADVGGGTGQFLADVLLRHPRSVGVLADQPQVVVDAKEVFEAAGVADRAEIVPCDFFAEVPAGCDAYLVKHTLHNWNDADAVRILRSIRSAIGADSRARLLVLDMLLTGPGQWDIGKLIDVESLAVHGSKERDRAEWDRITAAAGFAPVNDPPPGDLVLLEFRPV